VSKVGSGFEEEVEVGCMDERRNLKKSQKEPASERCASAVGGVKPETRGERSCPVGPRERRGMHELVARRKKPED